MDKDNIEQPKSRTIEFDDIEDDLSDLENDLEELFNPEPEPENRKKSEPKEKPYPEHPIQKEPDAGLKKTVSSGKKPELIDEIMKIQDLVDGYEPHLKSYYQKMKVAELREILGNLANSATEQYTQGKRQEKLDDRVEYEHVSRFDGGRALFEFNQILCLSLEKVSIGFTEKVGTNLEGLTDDMKEHREMLEDVLREIYLEHADVVQEYLTPINRYAMTMIAITSNRLNENKKKLASSTKPQPL